MSWTGIDPTYIVLLHLADDHYTTRATSESAYISIITNLNIIITGIDPSHVDLQQLANDHSTTRDISESSYFSMVANLSF